ncbi:DUF4236 domain-containing protein [Vibrio diabolicus]|uniref:DUF4236 domain-containing protein n=1 Tax=Vibrio diabolicus TaxID=50719 RepID=UPI002495993E|nr:DUF4236 domain-containing protein [Vibrio diabolicus]
MRKTNITSRNSFRIFGLITVNFVKSGFTSVSIGGRWLTLNIGRRGAYIKGSLSGTGLGAKRWIWKPTGSEAQWNENVR